TSYDYGSFNPGTNNEEITVFTNSDPIALTAGRWYLGVYGNSATNVTYTIVVTDYTNALPNIILLQNMIPYTNSNSGAPPATDYCKFIGRPSSVRPKFEIDWASGSMQLYVHRGLPLADPANFDYTSGPTNNDQEITVFNYSTPVALGPGDWFISAVNTA